VDEFSNPSNPWAFEERIQSDTRQPGRLLSSFPRGEGLTGRLLSKPFGAPQELSFFLAGHDGYPDKPINGNNLVRLVDARTGGVLRSASPPRNDVAQRIEWRLSDLAGREVRLEVIDNDTAGAYAWVAFGRIQPPVVEVPALAPSRVAERQLAAARLAGVTTAETLKSGLSDQLLALAKNTAADVAARSAAWSVVRPSQSNLMGVVADPQVPFIWRRQIMDMVASENFEKSSAFQIKLFKEAPRSVQAKVTGAAVRSLADVNYVLSAVEEDMIPVAVLADPGSQDMLGKLGDERARQRLQVLLARVQNLDEATAKLVDQRRRLFDRNKADLQRGNQLFEQLCTSCHQLAGKGSLVGPQLDGIGNRGVERLIEDILDPNRNVDTAFRTSAYVLPNGDVESGLFRREEGAVVVLANSAGQEFTLNKSEITASRQSMTSLMPSNFAEALSQAQFNDLLAFLLEQR
jgi:putative heme-binding domain-containing protein